MRVQLLISQWITVKSESHTPVSFSFSSFLSHFPAKWATASRWNFIVYVFIHCEAGITDFTRSFKQMSEYSIDWNVNTGSCWARVTQLEVQPLSSLSFIVSQRSKKEKKKKVFSLNCWLSRSNLHQGLGILGNEKAENERLILILQSKAILMR